LCALGIRISLDDFGAGFSSLSYLHHFPLHTVKIDRSFLDGIDKNRSRTILCGTAKLSADLGMEVIVEGIETVEQLELLSTCDAITRGQGFFFSPPLAAEQIRGLLKASQEAGFKFWRD
jgi:EAL domain-containing protein (putative c-di-GMP-specific phosphodiesterase class I)